MQRAIFVYGTLLPGRLRWPLVAADVETTEPAAVRGTLYDTGHGYPAATFAVDGDTDGAVIHGAVLHVRPGRTEAVLTLLDQVETGYRRVGVQTTDAREVITYEWTAPTHDLTPLPTGRWDSADER